MKRFLLFAGSHYYANGGWSDFRGWYDTVADAEAALPQSMAVSDPHPVDDDYWWHVVDSQTGEWCAGDNPDRIGMQGREWPSPKRLAAVDQPVYKAEQARRTAQARRALDVIEKLDR